MTGHRPGLFIAGGPVAGQVLLGRKEESPPRHGGGPLPTDYLQESGAPVYVPGLLGGSDEVMLTKSYEKAVCL